MEVSEAVQGTESGTADSPEDMMTKPVPSYKFVYFLELLGVQIGEG